MAGLPRHTTLLTGNLVGLHAFRLSKAPVLVPYTQWISSSATKHDPATAKPQLYPLNHDHGQSRPNPPPLSVLSTGQLIRSTFISTISTSPLLLLPALHTLSFLCKPIGGRLLDVDKNPVLHKILKATFYNQFCAGETPAETRATVKQLKDFGFRGVIMTYAKETVYDNRTKSIHGTSGSADVVEEGAKVDPEIEDWKTGVMGTLDLVGQGDYLALKLTGAGRAVLEAFAAGEAPPRQMIDALNHICGECQKRGMTVIVDAESQKFQKAIDKVTLDLMRRFNRDGTAVVYNTYQAYLKSTTDNVVKHLSAANEEGFTLGLKLVRGAYLLTEDRSLIHDTKQDTDNAYNSIAQGALKQHIGELGSSETKPFPSVKLLLCGHNKESIFAALRLHQSRVEEGLPTVDVTFAQSHGMADAVSFELLQQKGSDGAAAVAPAVLKCSTWGTLGECLAYLLRRAVENKSAVMRTGDEHRALKGECWRRMRRVIVG